MVVYCVKGDENGITVMQLWTLHALDCPIPTQQDPPKESETQVSPSKVPDGHLPGEKAFYMAEFNPSGDIFAVEEVFYRTTLVHLISPKGKVLKSVDLMAMLGNKESRPVNSLFISPYHDGLYAIGL